MGVFTDGLGAPEARRDHGDDLAGAAAALRGRAHGVHDDLRSTPATRAGGCCEGPKTYQDHQGGKKQGFSQKVIWPPMALGIGLLRSSALQNDGHDVPVILQCRTPRETNPKGHWGPNYFFVKSVFLLPPCTQSWYTQSYEL